MNFNSKMTFQSIPHILKRWGEKLQSYLPYKVKRVFVAKEETVKDYLHSFYQHEGKYEDLKSLFLFSDLVFLNKDENISVSDPRWLIVLNFTARIFSKSYEHAHEDLQTFCSFLHFHSGFTSLDTFSTQMEKDVDVDRDVYIQTLTFSYSKIQMKLDSLVPLIGEKEVRILMKTNEEQGDNNRCIITV